MAVTDELQAARAGLQMINPAPFNAEAPPEALAGEITPTELHYVRSNFSVPAHDGTLGDRRRGREPDRPSRSTTYAPCPERASRDPRMRG